MIIFVLYRKTEYKIKRMRILKLAIQRVHANRCHYDVAFFTYETAEPLLS